MRLHELLERLAERLEISDLQPDGNGACEITFDGTYRVLITPDGQHGVRLVSRVGQLSSDPYERENQLRDRLQRVSARQSGEWNGRETLTVDEDTGALLIFQVVPTDEIHVDDAFQHIESFVNAAAFWAEAVSTDASAALHLLH